MGRFVCIIRIASFAIALAVLSACATTEVLQSYSSTVPDSVDFSGTWVIRDGFSADQRRFDRAIQRIGNASDSKPADRQAKKKNRNGLVHVFLRMASSYKISQTRFALFFSLDRSVVQEFRFGENREVSIGEIVAQRTSGWDGTAYVVDTLDKRGMKLTERYWLNDQQNVLHREIKLRSRNNKTEILIQLFDRSES